MAGRVTVLGRMSALQDSAVAAGTSRPKHVAAGPVPGRETSKREDDDDGAGLTLSRLTHAREDDEDDEVTMSGGTRGREDDPDDEVERLGPETRSREDDRTTESRGEDA